VVQALGHRGAQGLFCENFLFAVLLTR
jgi:hypothetical protein